MVVAKEIQEKIIKLKNDIEILKGICINLEQNYFDEEWTLSDYEYDDLYRITGMEEHDWDENTLSHYIDGMQRVLQLLN